MKSRNNSINDDISLLEQNVLSIIKNQSDLGYHMPNFINSPVDRSRIRVVEEALELRFNPELIQLFITINGVKLNDNMTNKGRSIMPSYYLFSLENAKLYAESMNWKVHFDFYYPFENVRTKYFPIAYDGAGNAFWVDLNVGNTNYGKIYWTNNFGEDPDYLFSSLSSFFEAINRGYVEKLFVVDIDGELSSDYIKWAQLCFDLDNTIKYWETEL